MVCRLCGREYPIHDGNLPGLFAPNEWTADHEDVTDVVKAFYEETPFPNYDDIVTRESLQAKARISVFARLLDEQLPQKALVLEMGCGTGQMSNFLGMNWDRKVIGADLCLNSLRLARDFRDRHGIANATFVQMNLFRPPFRDGTFDFVISNGVLHHTANPRSGFASAVKKLKPGGIVSIGLYNSLGRLPTLWRRWMIERFGDRFAALDSRLRDGRLNTGRWQAWFRDQYKHPHESRHSMSEVLEWFEEEGVDFLSSVPRIGDVDFSHASRLFEPTSAGSSWDRWTTEATMLLSGGTDGGLFIMVGRKRGGPERS